MNRFSTVSGAIALVAAVAFAASSAEAARGGKGGKNTTAIAEFSEIVDCSAGSGGILGEIDVGSDTSQCFTYTISIRVLDDWTIFDEAPTTFDLSSEAEICAYQPVDEVCSGRVSLCLILCVSDLIGGLSDVDGAARGSAV